MSILNLFKKNPTEKSEVKNISTEQEKTVEQSPVEKNEAKSDELNSKADTKEAKKTNGKREVHNLLILDESGSMKAIYQPALTGVNETLQTIREAQKEHTDQKHFVTLVAFDTSRYNQIYKNTPAEDAKDITKEQYRPSGCTPLFDTMGRSINELRKNVGEDDVVLATIITDGYENASHEYDGRAIKALVEEMKAQGWVFTYIGANQDVEAMANSMSIDNHLYFEASLSGASDMFEKELRCRKRFFNRVSSGYAANSDYRSNYFNEDEEENDK